MPKRQEVSVSFITWLPLHIAEGFSRGSGGGLARPARDRTSAPRRPDTHPTNHLSHAILAFAHTRAASCCWVGAQDAARAQRSVSQKSRARQQRSGGGWDSKAERRLTLTMAATVWRTSTSLVSGTVITTTHSPPTSSSHSSYSSPQSVTVDLARKLETSAWLEPGGVTGTAGGVRKNVRKRPSV